MLRLYSRSAFARCRGIKVAHNADLKLKFDTYKSSFAVGSLMTLPAFTSVTLDDKVASGFGDHLLFTFIRGRALSQPLPCFTAAWWLRWSVWSRPFLTSSRRLLHCLSLMPPSLPLPLLPRLPR